MFLRPAGVDIGFSIGDSHGGGSDSGKVAELMVIALPATHSTAVVVTGVKVSEDNGLSGGSEGLSGGSEGLPEGPEGLSGGLKRGMDVSKDNEFGAPNVKLY